MATTEVRRPALSTREIAPSAPTGRQPIEWWAFVGILFALFWAYVLIQWVTGPFFESVDGGPSELPGWMSVLFTVWQAAAIPLVGVGLYFAVWRPWRRIRTVPLLGLLFVAFIFMSLQDPGSDFFGYWYLTNAHLLNMGSFVNEIPGWLAFGEPGAQIPWVPLFHLIEYPFGMFVPVLGGVWLMKRWKARWGFSGPTLVAMIFPVMMVWDLIIEGAFTTLGFYTMPGGHLSFFPDAYNKFPLIEPVFIAALLTPVVALVYFKNDRGETVVERGVEKLDVSDGRKVILRLLALVAATQLIYLLFYNLPIATYMGAKPGVWPAAVQEQSYFTDGLCGEGTPRLCPGPGIPLTQKFWINSDQNQPPTRLEGPGSSELDEQGAGAAAGRFEVVPLDPGGPTPFEGRVLGVRSR